ncbi:MAG: STAS domain-containing protein [Actinobacteria bacterium]|nr:STAS domain-containing protein [Actinomycetota bacterium]
MTERVREALSLQPSQLVLDISGCGFIDATGVEILLDAHRAARRASSELILRGPNHRVLHVLTLCGLDGVFHVERGDAGT